MKRTSLFLTLGLFALATPSLAQAATFSPAGTTVTFTGATTVPPCSATLSLTINAAGSAAAVTAGALTGPAPCPTTLPIFSTPWAVSVTAPAVGVATDLAISNVTVMTLPGTCGPATLQVQWNDATDTITVPLQSLGACMISGSFTAGTNVSITVP